MVIQNTPTKIDKIASLRIGQRGENLATDIKMDVSDWIAVHPDANYYCLFKRPDEVQVQPVLSSLEEDVLTWTVRAWECAIIGVGYLEVRAVNPDTGLVAKSRVIPCAIEDSVIDDEGPVPPEMTWVGEVLAAKDTAVAAKTAAEEARDTAQTTVGGAIAGIQAEGQTQIGAVQAEGTTQVGNVNAAGTTQVGAVQAKGTEVINSIPSDYSTLSGEVTDLKSAINNKQDTISNSLTLPAGESYAVSARVHSGSSQTGVISILPYRASGYAGVVIAHTQENLITTPYSSNSITNLAGLSCVSDNDANKLAISGTKSVSYGYQYYFVSDMDDLPAGDYVFCGVGKFEYLNGTNGTTKLFWKQGSSEITVAEKCDVFPVYSKTFSDSVSDVSLYINVYGTYELDSEFYPLFGRGEKISKSFGTTVYGGEFNWNTGILTSKYDASGNELSEPVEYELGASSFAEYSDNWFYSDSGLVMVGKSAMLGQLIDEAGQTIFFDTLADLRNADASELRTVETLGYYAKYDGGGAMYNIRAKQESDTDNGGTIIVIGDYVAEMVLEQYSTVDVRKFGAKGDGLANDTTAFSNAISACNHIIVPYGTYILSSALTVADGKWIDIDQNATIKPNGNNGLFIMRKNTKMTGGLLYTYGYDGYTASVVKIINDSSADLENVTISGVRFRGRAQGIAIEIDSSISQVLYCHIDIQAYGYDYIICHNRQIGWKSFSCCYIKIVANYSNCVFLGNTSASVINVTGESGNSNETSDYCLNLTGGGYNTIIFGMVDVGNPGHIPFGILLSESSMNNVIVGISQSSRSIVDNGFNNHYPLADKQNVSMTNYTIADHRYNNVLSNIADRYSTTITLNNCTAPNDYSEKAFLDSVSAVVPLKSWQFTAVDDTQEASVQIDIESINILPTALAYEWDKRPGYGFGAGFNKVKLYGKVDGSNEFVEIASKEYDREYALTYDIGSEIMLYTNVRSQVYKDIRIVLGFEKSASYQATAFITSLGLFGSYADTHQAFVQTNGDIVYGDIDFVTGKSITIKSPNGTAYKLTVGNDGTLGTELLS